MAGGLVMSMPEGSSSVMKKVIVKPMGWLLAGGLVMSMLKGLKLLIVRGMQMGSS